MTSMDTIPTAILQQLQSIVGASHVLTDPESLYSYSYDVLSRKVFLPLAVLLPASTGEISAVMRVCNEQRIPVTVRGGGTGVSGGAIPCSGGIVLSMARLDRIIALNTIDRTVTAEAGVVTGKIREAAVAAGLVFPQNISSAGSSFIGGNVAVCSGSPKSLRYGSIRQLVVNLEVVLADGRVMWTGRNVTKDATGFNLTQLFVGSEGSLGIITKVVLQLTPAVTELLAMVAFSSLDALFDCVYRLFKEGCSPSAMEFIDARGYQLVSRLLGRSAPASRPVEGLLWIELEGKDDRVLLDELLAISELVRCYTDEDISIGQTRQEIDSLWEMRARAGDAVMAVSAFRDIDISVPRSTIKEMYAALRSITAHTGIPFTLLGHIGDGNFHINLLQMDIPAAEWEEKVTAVISRVFESAIKMGGTISGEHGIGSVHLPHLPVALGPCNLEYMKAIKRLFDNNNILNPRPSFFFHSKAY